MTTWFIIFWLSAAILFYCYLGYGILVFVINKIRPSHPQPVSDASTERLPVTLIVTAFNEAPVLEEKIRNCMALDYPTELLRIIFVTDGSQDGSPEIAGRHERIELLHDARRMGKYAALKRAMRHVDSPVVIF